MAYSIYLSGRVAFVTRASGGLGAQFAPIMSEDLDALIVMLASAQSHFVNGAVIAADDGFAA